MTHSDTLNHSRFQFVFTLDDKQAHEKHSPLKIDGNEEYKRPENIFKKNIIQTDQNSSTTKYDKNCENCPVPQGRKQSESHKKTETESLVKHKEHCTSSNTKLSKICSCACCKLESVKGENTLKDLQTQIQELTSELSNYKTENLVLRKDIFRAKNVVKRVIGRNVESFEDIVKKMTEDSWIGQQEKIVSLKKELRVLKDELRERGMKTPSPVKRRESISPGKISNDRKIHWRLTLERQSILRQTGREKQDLIDSRDKMKGRFELMFNRNNVLEEEVKSIREKLKEIKKDSNGHFISRLQELEKKTKFGLEEKSKLRRSVEDEELKEKQLLSKLEDLRAEIHSQVKILETTKKSLSEKKSDEIALLSSVSGFESEALTEMGDIDKNLNKVDEGHKKNVDSLNNLIDFLFTFEEIFSNLRQRSPASNRPHDELSSITSIYTNPCNQASPERVESERTDSINGCIRMSTVQEIMRDSSESVLENAETAIHDTKQKMERIFAHKDPQFSSDKSSRLKEKYKKYVTLLKVKEKENLKKSEHIYDLLDQLKEKTEEILKDNSQLWRTAWQMNTMSLKNKRLRKLVKHYADTLANQQQGFCHITWETLIRKGELVCDIFVKENKFLKMLISNVAQSKAYDFDLYTLMCKRKESTVQKSQLKINIHQLSQ